MTREQADRIERKLNALCRATGAPLFGLDLSEPPEDGPERTIAAVRKYAGTLARSQVSTHQSFAAELLKILDGTP